jgi:hypothetical protein
MFHDKVFYEMMTGFVLMVVGCLLVAMGYGPVAFQLMREDMPSKTILICIPIGFICVLGGCALFHG